MVSEERKKRKKEKDRKKEEERKRDVHFKCNFVVEIGFFPSWTQRKVIEFVINVLVIWVLCINNKTRQKKKSIIFCKNSNDLIFYSF